MRSGWASIGVLSVLAACRECADAPAVAWPAGTVLALDGQAISVDEVDAVGAIVARVEPQGAVPYLRRIALTNVVFARVAARLAAAPGARDAARERALAWRESAIAWRESAVERTARAASEAPAAATEPVAIQPGPGTLQKLRGGVLELGLETWGCAIDAPLDAWSEPIELPGAWRVACVRARSRGLRPGDVALTVDAATFPWLEPGGQQSAIDARLDRAKLEFVDESWRDVVPTSWQRRLRGTP